LDAAGKNLLVLDNKQRDFLGQVRAALKSDNKTSGYYAQQKEQSLPFYARQA